LSEQASAHVSANKPLAIIDEKAKSLVTLTRQHVPIRFEDNWLSLDNLVV